MWKVIKRTSSIFDRKIKSTQQYRSSFLSNLDDYKYIRNEVALRLHDRINDIIRKQHLILELGLPDISLLNKDSLNYTINILPFDLISSTNAQKIKATEENFSLCENKFDLVVSNLCLHWMNDLASLLKNVNYVLKPDGAFLATMFGHDTLFQLRSALRFAETERKGKFYPRVSPFVKIDDVGRLLHTAGFKLITIDVDEITVHYPSAIELMCDLRGSGESKAFADPIIQGAQMGKELLLATSAVYAALYGENYDNKNSQKENTAKEFSIPATFQIINMIGWKADPNQPTPAARGSGQISLKDLDKWEEFIKPN